MRFTDTFIKMNSCVVGATVGRPFCVIKFAIVYENFGVGPPAGPNLGIEIAVFFMEKDLNR